MTDGRPTAGPGETFPRLFEVERGDGYRLSTDPARIDVDAVHDFLANQSYWARGMPRAQLERGLAHSLLIGIFAPDGTMAAFARVLTDYAVFAYLRDVFTQPAHRGRGLASWLAAEIRNHPDLATVGTWTLATADAHAVYERAGYRRPPDHERFMTWTRPRDAAPPEKD